MERLEVVFVLDRGVFCEWDGNEKLLCEVALALIL
jgi:hypothetical protein